MPEPITQNTLFYGDNLPILREYLPDASVDLIYLDPPFNSNRTYNVLFKDESGEDSEAQIAAFEDTWHWNQATARTYEDLVLQAPIPVSKMIAALRDFIGPNQMMAYLVMMTARLVELHRILKPTGSLYLHCDPTASHYLKVILDAIFGAAHFRNEIVWQRTSSHSDSKRWAAVHDTIFCYSKSDAFTWNPVYTEHDPAYVETFYRYSDEKGRYRHDHIIRSASMGPRPNLSYEYHGYTPQWGWRMTRDKLEALDKDNRIYWSNSGRPYLKRYLDEQKGNLITSVITDIPPVGPQAAERLGYPTQKPLALLERIIQTSSNPGDWVLDPFCGCGTAVAAAQKLERRWIGIDITFLSISLQRSRLQEMFPDLAFQVIGEPQTLADAHYLAQQDRFQFEWWALSLVGARPTQPTTSRKGKKGADRGVDGVINFMDDASDKPKRVLVQVKSGKVSARDVRDLGGALEREKAAIGLLLTLETPTAPMEQEAAASGFYRSPGWNQQYPRVQLLTIESLLGGAKPQMPPAWGTFKQAQRVRESGPGQATLDLGM
ncbi:MAG TPA: DNA methyltransferase [Anaerolineae bacterium]|nr:DNA methyltransferase [Anaerolineae bacterium]